MIDQGGDDGAKPAEYTVVSKSSFLSAIVASKIAAPPPLSSAQVDALVGREIEKRRDQLGMNRNSLGKVLGVSPRTIERYEKGHLSLGVARLVEIAGVLKIPPSAFFQVVASASVAETGVVQEAWQQYNRSQNEEQILESAMQDVIVKIEMFIQTLEKLKHSE